MKHSFQVTFLIILLFLLTQGIGYHVLSAYAPEVSTIIIQNETHNQTVYNLPYGLEPPPQTNPSASLLSLLIGFIFALLLIFGIMRFDLALVLKCWFGLVVVLALAVSFVALLPSVPSFVPPTLALVLGCWKILRPNKYIHNSTELFIYPGIAALLVPLLSPWTALTLLILISGYDIYAVWHSGFMQKMAQYQLKNVGVFGGLLIPYVLPGQQKLLIQARKKKRLLKKIQIQLAILGGGDIIFPLILAGTFLFTAGPGAFLTIVGGATAGLTYLLVSAQKGKFYPAMPYITAGCISALGIRSLMLL